MTLVIIVSYLTKTNEIREVVRTTQQHTKLMKPVKQ